MGASVLLQMELACPAKDGNSSGFQSGVVIAGNGCCWRPRSDSNAQPSDPKSDALSIELRGQFVSKIITDIFSVYFPEGQRQGRKSPMSILQELLASIQEDAPVRTVCVGVHWTLVCSRGCGLASTLIGDQPHGHEKVRDVGRLHQKSARELAEFARSDNLLEASIGLAAINSLLEVDPQRSVQINAAEVLLEHGMGKKVAVVGHFPFISRLRQAVAQLWVIEQRPAAGEYPAHAADEIIPQADVVALTGSALINHTLDALLELCQPQAVVMVLGPTTPLSPLLFQHGVGILSGARVVDEAAALRTISQGATFQQVEGVELLTLMRRDFTQPPGYSSYTLPARG